MKLSAILCVDCGASLRPIACGTLPDLDSEPNQIVYFSDRQDKVNKYNMKEFWVFGNKRGGANRWGVG